MNTVLLVVAIYLTGVIAALWAGKTLNRFFPKELPVECVILSWVLVLAISIFSLGFLFIYFFGKYLEKIKNWFEN